MLTPFVRLKKGVQVYKRLEELLMVLIDVESVGEENGGQRGRDPLIKYQKRETHYK